MSKCICQCHQEEDPIDAEAEKMTLKINRLLARRHELVGIGDNLSQVRAGYWNKDMYHTPEFQLLIAVEGLWRLEKRRLNKELREVDLKQIKR